MTLVGSRCSGKFKKGKAWNSDMLELVGSRRSGKFHNHQYLGTGY